MAGPTWDPGCPMEVTRLYLTEVHLHAPNKEIEQKPRRGSLRSLAPTAEFNCEV